MKLRFALRSILFAVVFSFIFLGCQTRSGDPSALRPPVTKLFLRDIALEDSNSLSGRIRLFWSGESSNGYVKSFEIWSDTNVCNTSIASDQSIQWASTTRTDSAFLFKIPQGKQFDLISFYVRAVDNNGLKDQNPPCLEVPVKNSLPKIEFLKPFKYALTDSIHSVLSLSWELSDADGTENLDTIFIKINDDGKWFPLPKSARTVTLIPTDPKALTTTTCKVLIGNIGTVYRSEVQDLKLKMEGQNRIFIRVKDISNAFSNVDTTNLFYLKRQKSDFLYIDSYKLSGSDRAVYTPILQSLYPSGYDVYDLNRNGDAYLPQNWNLTFSQFLKLYKKVFWASDLSTYGGYTSIELGVTAIQNYLNGGGKVLFSLTKLPADVNSPIYQFSPFDSISSKPGQARLSGTAKIPPSTLFSTKLDTLANTTLITGATPGYLKSGAQSVFSATYTQLNGWSGPNILAGAAIGGNSKANQVFFTTDIYSLNGRPEALSKLFDQILNTEFEP